MRICNFTTTFWSYETVAGVSNTAYLLAKRLIEDYDAEVFVFAPFDKNQKTKKNEDHMKLHVRRFDTIGPKALGFFKKKTISEKFDLVHSYHYGYYPASAGFRHAKNSNIPHFFTTAFHPHQLNFFKKAIFNIYNRNEGRKILSNSSAVLPFNSNEMDQLMNISNGTYKILPSPINTDIFYPDRKKNKKITIGYVGNLLPWKGADTAFKICSELEKEGYDVSFVFVGRGMLEREIKNKASDNFAFLKDIPIAKLADVYNSIDIMIYPSFYESFGRVLAEAITCGVPVISTKVGAIPETVGPGGILVDYGDWEKMKEYTVKLIENKNLRSQLGKKGSKYAKMYDYNKVSEKLYEIYSEHV